MEALNEHGTSSEAPSQLSHRDNSVRGPGHSHFLHKPTALPLTPPPDGGYGWVVTISIALINGHSWGVNSVYSVFLAHFLANNTFPGGTRLQYGLIGSLSVGCTLLVSPVINIVIRKVGTRPIMVAGALVQSAGLICASFSTRIWQLFISQGLLFGLGMGMLFIPSCGIISQWFLKKRAFANGIAMAGAGLGGFTYSLGAGAMIRNFGVPWTYRVISIVAAVINVVCALLVKTRYQSTATGTSSSVFDRSLLRKRDFLLILAFGFLSMLGYFVLIFTLANYANSIGLDASEASWIPSLFMLGQAVGRPIIGKLSDIFGHTLVTSVLSLLTGVFSMTIWVNARSFGVLILFALLEGSVAGVFWVNSAPIIAQAVGLSSLPSALNMLWLTIVLPSIFSEPIALEIVAGTGRYLGAQLFTGMTFVAAAVCMGYLHTRKSFVESESTVAILKT